MTLGKRQRERGVVLLALLAAIVLAASWLLVKQLNAETGGMAAARKVRNAAVLNRAKQALIGYIAMQSANSGEPNPGALPCPEAGGYFDNPSQDGQAAGTCSLPKVGRFPWRTIGTDKLVDATGEPLWYVVSPGWALTAGNTSINSNSVGQLTVDGAGNSAVALIIAPGPAFSVPACGANAAISQTRPTIGTPDWRNYLECENATNPADAVFVTTGPSGSFNDQVVTITAAEILPGIEAAIAKRIERDIAPALKSMYNGGSWSGSSSTPLLPYPAQFANPSTSAMQGSSSTLQGLLPLNYAETSPGSGTLCTAGAPAPRCSPAFVSWTSANMSGASTYNQTCTTTATQINCSFNYFVCVIPFLCGTTTSVPFTVNATANNVGMAMRQLNSSTTAMTNVSSVGSLTAALNPNGSATMALSGQASVSSTSSGLILDLVCGLSGLLGLLYDCNQASLSIPITVFADHPLLDANDATYGWFMRNKWHEVAYYSVAAGFAPGGAASCTTGGTCLTVNYHRDAANAVDAGKQRAIIILSGRSLTGAARPNGTLSDWLEGANADGSSPFEMRSATLPINRSFNDRFAVISSN